MRTNRQAADELFPDYKKKEKRVQQDISGDLELPEAKHQRKTKIIVKPKTEKVKEEKKAATEKIKKEAAIDFASREEKMNETEDEEASQISQARLVAERIEKQLKVLEMKPT